MAIDIKQAAEELLKIASLIEKEAEEKSLFICEGCNHTASLKSINEKRIKLAAESGITKVATVTVNEKVACPACAGVMSYAPTEESEKYYYNEKTAKDKDKNIEDESEFDLGNIGLGDMEEDAEEETVKETVKDTEKDTKKNTEEPAGDTGEEMVKEEPSEDTGEVKKEPVEDIFEPVDEQKEKKDEEDNDGKEKKKKNDKADDGKANLDKNPPPQFKDMPKEASDRYFDKVSRYSV